MQHAWRRFPVAAVPERTAAGTSFANARVMPDSRGFVSTGSISEIMRRAARLSEFMGRLSWTDRQEYQGIARQLGEGAPFASAKKKNRWIPPRFSHITTARIFAFARVTIDRYRCRKALCTFQQITCCGGVGYINKRAKFFGSSHFSVGQINVKSVSELEI